MEEIQKIGYHLKKGIKNSLLGFNYEESCLILLCSLHFYFLFIMISWDGILIRVNMCLFIIMKKMVTHELIFSAVFDNSGDFYINMVDVGLSIMSFTGLS